MSVLEAGIGSGLLSDAMDALGLASNACGGFRLSTPQASASGRAFTLRQVTLDELPDGTAQHGEVAENHLASGDILVIDCPEGVDAATWGGGHTLRALGRHAAGVLINGAVRDCLALGQYDLPVMFRDTSPKRSKGRLVTAEIGGRVVVNGVAISPGDFVCFDADGITCVPAATLDAVLAKCAEIRTWEDERDNRLKARITHS